MRLPEETVCVDNRYSSPPRTVITKKPCLALDNPVRDLLGLGLLSAGSSGKPCLRRICGQMGCPTIRAAATARQRLSQTIHARGFAPLAILWQKKG
jgi:hypothetical protein